MKNPYCDDPHNYGILRTSADDLKYYAKEIAEMGFQMNTHAIGDSTVSVLLNEYKKVLSEIEDPRWRIEHSQVVDMNEFELSVSETTVDDLLVNLINNKHYIKPVSYTHLTLPTKRLV